MWLPGLEVILHKPSRLYRKILVVLYGFAISMGLSIAIYEEWIMILVIGLSILGYKQFMHGIPMDCQINWQVEKVEIVFDIGLLTLLRLYGATQQKLIVIFRDQWTADLKRQWRWLILSQMQV